MSASTHQREAARRDQRRRRRHATRTVRPRLAGAWVTALLIATLVIGTPAALGGLLLLLIAAGRWLGAGSTTGRMLRVGIPFAVVLLVIQTLIDRTGLTVVARLGDAGPLGQLDITAEALAGAVTQALRVLCGLTVSAMALELVDVDRVLASVRRRAPRFGVTATLALRLAPALAADGRRYADGLRSRADAQTDARLSPGERRLVVDALIARTLDRASDAAAILELRGLSRTERRGAAPTREPWSDVERRAAAVATLIAVAIALILLLGVGR